MTKIQKGLKPSKRSLASPQKGKKLTANQWQNTPQQNMFMKLWTDPTQSTFGNAYQAGLAAGYSPHYSRQLASPSVLNKWITEYKNRIFFTDEHIRQGIQQIALKADDSRSPDDTRLKSYEILAKISGMIDNKNQQVNIVNVQPILAGESVRPVKADIIDIPLTED